MIKKLILLVFLALVVFSAIYALWGEKEYTTSSNQAYQVFMSGESLRKKLYYRDAAEDFEKAAKLDTNFAMAYCRLAQMYAEFGEKDSAKVLIEKAASLFPLITPKEQLNIDIIKSALLEQHQAHQEYVDQFIEQFPGDVESHRYQADRYIAKHEFEKAIEQYEIIIDKDPGYALAYNMLGYLNYWNGNFDEALTNIKKYSVIADKEANPHDSYGELLMYMGRYDDAIKEFEIANRIKPDLDFVLHHLGVVHRTIGKYRDAIGFFERAREFARNEVYSARVDEDIAFTLFLAGKTEDAIAILDGLHEGHPKWYSVTTLLGFFAAEVGDFAKAEECLASLKKVKTAGEVDSTIGEDEKETLADNQAVIAANIAFHKGEYDKAVAFYEQAMERVVRPNSILIRSFLARVYIEAGDYSKAIETLEMNLQDNPNDPRSLFYMARVYREKGDTENQRKMLLSFLSVMSGADEDEAMVASARSELDSLTEYTEM